MTEAEWLAGTDPEPMLRFVSGRTSGRKLRLFAAAVGAVAARGRVYPEGEAALAAAERYADHGIGREALLAAEAAAWDGHLAAAGRGQAGRALALWAAAWAADRRVAAEPGEQLAGVREGLGVGADWDLCRALDDIFGNPFRPVAADPSWLTSAVLALVHRMYDSKDFSPMPILADALQEAGCDNTDVLDHCRGEGPHTRGCWVIDMLTGRR